MISRGPWKILAPALALSIVVGLAAAVAVAESQVSPGASRDDLIKSVPPVTTKPGYVTPPENSGGVYPVNGEPIYKAKCAQCHEPAIGRAPERKLLEARAPEEVYDALTIGTMQPMAQSLSPAQIYGVVRYLTGKSPTPDTVKGPDPNICKVNGRLQIRGPQWTGWGRDLVNSRYQPTPGFTAAEIPRLKVKWGFAYAGTKNSEPMIFGDRVFVASLGGLVYSLDAASGCVHWRFDLRGGARAAMSLAPDRKAPSGFTLYVGGDRSYVYALDAGSGKELWNVRVDTHKVSRITGSPALFKGMLYVPLSSSEESQGDVAAYGCCTFIGNVVAIDVATGKVAWKQAVLNEKPHPTRLNEAGTQMYGPAGAAIWSSVTIDAKRGQLYVSTGDSYTEVLHPASDAVVAMALKTGKIRWVHQVVAGDNYVTGTINAPHGKLGPDFDFGCSPMLMHVGGRDLIVTANKNSIVYAMDPDTGKSVWETSRLGSGGPSGGFLWGTATDGKMVFAALNDMVYARFGYSQGPGRPGVFALDPATGATIWRVDAQRDVPCNVPSGRCWRGYTQALTAIPGAVFAGSQEGRLQAFAASDGRKLWEYDTTTPVDTVNGVKAASGGSLSGGGATIAGGRLFVHSGWDGSAGARNLLLAFTLDGK